MQKYLSPKRHSEKNNLVKMFTKNTAFYLRRESITNLRSSKLHICAARNYISAQLEISYLRKIITFLRKNYTSAQNNYMSAQKLNMWAKITYLGIVTFIHISKMKNKKKFLLLKYQRTSQIWRNLCKFNVLWECLRMRTLSPVSAFSKSCLLK